jgi:hypothetical protein
MPYGPKPVSRCREVTILCKMDRHTRTSSFKVWERVGLSGEDAARETLYEGPDFAWCAWSTSSAQKTCAPATPTCSPTRSRSETTGLGASLGSPST